MTEGGLAQTTKAIQLGCRWAETSSKSGDQVDTLFEDIARTVLHNKNQARTVGLRASLSPGGEQGQEATPGLRRPLSLPAQKVRRMTFTSLRRGNTVRLSNKSDPATKSRWKCSIL